MSGTHNAPYAADPSTTQSAHRNTLPTLGDSVHDIIATSASTAPSAPDAPIATITRRCHCRPPNRWRYHAAPTHIVRNSGTIAISSASAPQPGAIESPTSDTATATLVMMTKATFAWVRLDRKSDTAAG